MVSNKCILFGEGFRGLLLAGWQIFCSTDWIKNVKSVTFVGGDHEYCEKEYNRPNLYFPPQI